jgi:hypothetical protein
MALLTAEEYAVLDVDCPTELRVVWTATRLREA